MTQNNPLRAAGVPSDLLSRVDAAAYLGVAKQTLAIWACTKRYDLKYVKVGRLVKYRKADLDQFIADNLKSAS